MVYGLPGMRRVFPPGRGYQGGNGVSAEGQPGARCWSSMGVRQLSTWGRGRGEEEKRPRVGTETKLGD